MGSFGLTDEMKTAIAASKVKSTEKESEVSNDAEMDEFIDLEDSADTVEIEKEVKKKEESLEEVLDREIKRLSKSLDIEFSEDDIWAMIYNSELTKNNITVIPGKLSVSFKVLNSIEHRNVSKAARDSVKDGLFEDDFNNEYALQLLAYGAVELGKPGKVKELSSDAKVRYDIFSKLPVVIFDKITRKWNDFARLAEAVAEKEFSQGN